MARGDLTDRQWERLRKLLPPERSGKRGRAYREHRAVLNGILWVKRTGAPWEELPERYPPRSTCHDRLTLWQRDGTWERLFQALLAEADAHGDLAWALAAVDSTTVRAHQHAAGARRQPAQLRRNGKRGGQTGCWGGPRSQSRRTDHQDPSGGGRERTAPGGAPDPWSAARQHPVGAGVGSDSGAARGSGGPPPGGPAAQTAPAAAGG
jgi:transposase